MNAKVQEFIDKMIEKQKGEELKQREELLISLGLIDEEKTKRGIVYLDNWDGTKDCKFDNEKNKYYKESFVPAAIEITDEEYLEILKYAPKGQAKVEKVKESTKTTWANAINITATIFLVLNIIGAFILAIEFGWIPIVIALTYCILWYPIIIGFSKIVAAAEKKL